MYQLLNLKQPINQFSQMRFHLFHRVSYLPYLFSYKTGVYSFKMTANMYFNQV